MLLEAFSTFFNIKDILAKQKIIITTLNTYFRPLAGLYW